MCIYLLLLESKFTLHCLFWKSTSGPSEYFSFASQHLLSLFGRGHCRQKFTLWFSHVLTTTSSRVYGFISDYLHQGRWLLQVQTSSTYNFPNVWWQEEHTIPQLPLHLSDLPLMRPTDIHRFPGQPDETFWTTFKEQMAGTSPTSLSCREAELYSLHSYQISTLGKEGALFFRSLSYHYQQHLPTIIPFQYSLELSYFVLLY